MALVWLKDPHIILVFDSQVECNEIHCIAISNHLCLPYYIKCWISTKSSSLRWYGMVYLIFNIHMLQLVTILGPSGTSNKIRTIQGRLGWQIWEMVQISDWCLITCDISQKPLFLFFFFFFFISSIYRWKLNQLI